MQHRAFTLLKNLRLHHAHPTTSDTKPTLFSSHNTTENIPLLKSTRHTFVETDKKMSLISLPQTKPEEFMLYLLCTLTWFQAAAARVI